MKVAFYGNCQMEALAGVYVRFVCLHIGGDVRFIDAYRPIREQDREFIADAGLLVVQKPPMALPTPWENLSTSARIHIVPHVSAEFLWPYTGKERFQNPRGPGIEDGVWPGEIGDEFLNRLIQAGTTPDAAVAAYLELDVAKQTHIDRRFELAMDQLRNREAGTAYKVADIIEAHFRTEHLFRSPNHPALRLSRYMALTFFQEIGTVDAARIRATKFLTVPPYPITELPIHPGVSRHFKLSYGKENQRYQFHHESRVTFEQYVRQYVMGTYNAALFFGLKNLSHGDFPAAVDNLKTALGQTPCSAGCHAALAEALWRSGQIDAALRAAEQAANLDPNSQDHPLLIAKIQTAAGNLPIARHNLDTAMALGAEPGPGYRSVATIVADQGHHADALLLADEALQADPLDPLTNAFAHRLEASTGGAAGTETAQRATINPTSKHARINKELALYLLRADRIDEALKAARRSVALDPASAICMALLGDLLMRTGAAAEGEAALRSAIALAPEDPGPRRQLAHWLRQAGNFSEAIPEMRKVIELKPEDAENTAILGHMLAQSGDFSAAEQFLRRAVDLAPENDHYRNDLAYILKSHSDERRSSETSSGG